MDDALKVLFGDVPAHVFFSRHWSAAPVLLPGPRDRFSGLFGWDDFLGLLDRHGPDLLHRLRIVKDGNVLKQGSYTLNDRLALAGRLDRILPDRINDLCSGGASLVVSGVRDYGGPLGELARRLEHLFGSPVSINAYYTPPGNKAFGVHYDPYDVFILQVLGQKHWQLFGLRTPGPLLEDKGDFRNPPEHPEEEHILCEGQALYIPRGFWHVAGTEASGSLHLTVGVRCRTYVDLLERLLEKLKETEPARARLALHANDLGHLSFDEGGILASLEALFQEVRNMAPGTLEELNSSLGRAEAGIAIPKP